MSRVYYITTFKTEKNLPSMWQAMSFLSLCGHQLVGIVCLLPDCQRWQFQVIGNQKCWSMERYVHLGSPPKMYSSHSFQVTILGAYSWVQHSIVTFELFKTKFKIIHPWRISEVVCSPNKKFVQWGTKSTFCYLFRIFRAGSVYSNYELKQQFH